MAQSFNLVARLHLQGPQNINQVVNRIQSRLNSITANVSLNVPAGAGSTLATFNNTLSQTNTLLTQVTSNAQAAAAALRTVGASGRAAGAGVASGAAGANATASNMKKVSAATQVATTEMAQFGKISALAVRRFLAFSIPAGIIVGLVMNIKKGVRAAVDFEREMVRVQQVTGRTTEGLRALTGTIGELSTTFGSASAELAEVTRTLAQAGLTAQQTRVALSAIAKSDLAPTFDSMKQTTEGAIAAMRQFGLAAEDLEGKLGSMNAVAGSFAVESADIISAIRRTGGAFQAAGGNLEELIALFTSVRSTTRESADSIATGFRTIFTRLQRPRTIQFLRGFGIELQNLEGKFVGPYKAVEELSRAMKNLDPRDVRFSRITEELGGFRQVSKVIPLIQQFATSQKALTVALSGTESLTEDAATAQQALAVQISKVGEEYTKLFREIVGSDLFKDLADSALTFAKNLADVVRLLEPIIPLITTLAGFKAVSVTRQFATGFIPGLLSAGGTGGGPTTGPQNAVAAQNQNTTATNRNTASQNQQTQASTQTMTSLIAALNSTTNAVNQNTMAVNGLRVVISALQSYMQARGAAAAAGGLAGGRGFQRGGPVPGSGRGDKVPAMLEPGEFVMRRTAVEAMGMDQMHAINTQKFAKGGPVKRVRIGLAALRGEPANTFPDRVYAPQEWGGRSELALSLTAQPLDPKIGANFERRTFHGLVNALRNASQDTVNRLGTQLPPAPRNFWVHNLRKANLFPSKENRTGTLGKMFEAVVTRLGNTAQFRPSDAAPHSRESGKYARRLSRQSVGKVSEPFDFIGGVRNAQLEAWPMLAGIPLVDAKRTNSAKNRRDVYAKGLTYLGKSAAAFRQNVKNRADNRKLAAGVIASGTPLQNAIKQLHAADKKAVAVWASAITGKRDASKIQAAVTALFDKKGLPAIRNLPTELRATLSGKYANRKAIQEELGGVEYMTSKTAFMERLKQLKYLKDGGVGSKRDRVPAMLEPGEFVINRHAAAKFGYDNLEAVNKVQRFAQGGIVRQFNAGGRAPNVGAGAGTGLFSVVILSSMAKSFTEAGSAADKMVDSMTRLVVVMTSLQLAGGMLQGFVRTLNAVNLQGGLLAGARGGYLRGMFGSQTRGVGLATPIAPRYLSPGGAPSFGPASATGPPTVGNRGGFKANANALSQSLFGLNAGMLALGAAVAVVAAGLYLWGRYLKKTSEEMAKTARTQQAMNAAIEERRAASTATSAGVGLGGGAAAGFVIGSVIPGIGNVVGTAVGAAIGGVTGLLYGAFGDMTQAIRELRKINREERAAEATTTLEGAFKELTSGDVAVRGSRSALDVAKGLREFRSLEQEARLNEDDEGAQAYNRSLRGFATQTEDVRAKLVEVAVDLDDFKNNTAAGAEVILALAQVQKKSTFEIERAIQNEIEARDKKAKRDADEAAAREQTNTLTTTLSLFNAALKDTVANLQRVAGQLDVETAISQGKPTVGRFTGRPGFGDFSRVASGGVANFPQFSRALEQAIGGVGDNRVFQNVNDISRALNEMPQVLTSIGAASALDPDDAQTQFEKAFDSRFAGVISDEISASLRNTIGGGINRFITKSGEGDAGAGKFLELARSNPQELLRQVGGQEYESILKQIDLISKGQLEAAKLLEDAILQQVESEMRIVKARDAMAKSQLESQQALFQATRRLPTDIFPLAEIRASRGARLSSLVQGTGVADADRFDVDALASRLGIVLDRIRTETAESNQRSLLADDEGASFAKAKDELGALNVEAQKLRMAMELLGETTDEAAQIQKTLNLLEEQKKTRFGLADRYTFGSREDRQKILQGILDTVRVTTGGVPIDRLSAERRGEVSRLLKEFSNVNTLMAGVDAFGRGLTGLEGNVGIVERRIGGINVPGPWQQFFGTGPNLSIDQFNPLQLNEEQESQVDQLRALYERRAEVETAFIGNMETSHDRLINTMQTEFQRFTARLVAELELINRERVERERSVKQDEANVLSGQQRALEDAGAIISPVFPDLEPQGIFRVVEALSDVENVATFQRRAAGHAAMQGLMLPSTAPAVETRGDQTVDLGITGKEFHDVLISTFKRLGRDVDATAVEEELKKSFKDFGVDPFEQLTQQGVIDKTQLNKLYADMSQSIADKINLEGPRTIRSGPRSPHPSVRRAIEERLATNRDKFIRTELIPQITEVPRQNRVDALRSISADAGLESEDDNAVRDLLTASGDAISKISVALGELKVTDVASLGDNLRKVNARLATLDEILAGLSTREEIQTRLGLGELTSAGRHAGSSEPKSLGGIMFKRQGTDTVPAMLTPGEFVVNAAATQKHMGLLHAINRGSSVVTQGGVSYARDGGYIDGGVYRRGDLTVVYDAEKDEFLTPNRDFALGGDLSQLEFTGQRVTARVSDNVQGPLGGMLDSVVAEPYQRPQLDPAIKPTGQPVAVDHPRPELPRERGRIPIMQPQGDIPTDPLFGLNRPSRELPVAKPGRRIPTRAARGVMPDHDELITGQKERFDVHASLFNDSMSAPLDYDPFTGRTTPAKHIAAQPPLNPAGFDKVLPEVATKVAGDMIGDLVDNAQAIAAAAQPRISAGVDLSQEFAQGFVPPPVPQPSERERLLAKLSPQARAAYDKRQKYQEGQAKRRERYLKAQADKRAAYRERHPGSVAGLTGEARSSHMKMLREQRDAERQLRYLDRKEREASRPQVSTPDIYERLAKAQGRLRENDTAANRRIVELLDAQVTRALASKGGAAESKAAGIYVNGELVTGENRANLIEQGRKAAGVQLPTAQPSPAYPGAIKTITDADFRDDQRVVGTRTRPTPKTGAFRTRIPGRGTSAYDLGPSRGSVDISQPTPNEIIKQASARLTELNQQKEDYLQLRKLLRYSMRVGNIPGVDMTPADLITLAREYGQIESVADLHFKGEFNPTGDPAQRAQIREWARQLEPGVGWVFSGVKPQPSRRVVSPRSLPERRVTPDTLGDIKSIEKRVDTTLRTIGGGDTISDTPVSQPVPLETPRRLRAVVIPGVPQAEAKDIPALEEAKVETRYIEASTKNKALPPRKPGEFRPRRPSAYGDRSNVPAVRDNIPTPDQIIKDAGMRLQELKEQKQDYDQLRELLNFSRNLDWERIPGVQMQPRQLIELTKSYGQLDSAAELLVEGNFNPTGNTAQRAQIRKWHQQLTEAKRKFADEYNKPSRQAGRDIQEYANSIGLGNLPLGLQVEDLTREQAEQIRAAKGMSVVPVASFASTTTGRGGTIKIAPNNEFWNERPGLLSRAARHEFGHAVDYYLGNRRGAGSGPASMQRDSGTYAWLSNPANAERWKKALIENHLETLPSGANRTRAVSDYASSYHFKSPKEVFAQILAGGTPALNELRDELISSIVPGTQGQVARYHQGGLVPGHGEQAAILQGGEYVLSRPAVQMLARGGVVKGYAEGGVATSSGGGGAEMNMTVSLSSESVSAFVAAVTEAMRAASDNFRTVFADVPSQITESLAGFTTSLESSGEVINQAAAQFQAGATAIQATAEALPESIAAALGDTTAAMTDSAQVLGTAIGEFNAAADGFGQSVAQLATTVADLAAATANMSGAATELRDALAQEITINVTHTHSPITVTVEGGETTQQDGEAFSQLVMDVVGPEIDSLRDRIRETGFGIA